MTSNWRKQEYPFDLGPYRKDVTITAQSTEKADEAKLWFDRGLNWTYAFHREEAVECFKMAIDADPTFAMAYWGVAYCNGVNYNLNIMFEDMLPCAKHAFEYSRRAYNLRERCTPVEKALIEALQCRYCESYKIDDTQRLNEDYVASMRRVYEQFPDDVDVGCLYAEALMMLRPWKLWNINTGEPAARTLEIKGLLEECLAREPNHPGLLHLYIHLMEMSATPEVALDVAERIINVVPDSGHLKHMSTHIFIQLGMYPRSADLNREAFEIDKKYLQREGVYHFHTMYSCHNLHFVVYASMMDGQFATAMQAAQDIKNLITPELLQVPIFSQYLEAYVPAEFHVLMRFGRYEDILAIPFPTQTDVYRYTIANLHFTRGIALAGLGRINEALEEERKLLKAADEVAPTQMLHVNTCKDMLEVAKNMLRGEIEYRQGDYNRAFASLRRAAELEDNLNYDEPPPWMQPARHALGALLLEQNRLDDAEKAFREDLAKAGGVAIRGHPENAWSLQGLKLCLQKRDKKEEVNEVDKRFQQAAARADMPIHAPCFCARDLIDEVQSA